MMFLLMCILVIHCMEIRSTDVQNLTQRLPICTDLSIGRWVNISSDVLSNKNFYSSIARHFYPYGPGEALNFSQVWIPHNCRYHRFTNQSLNELTEFILRKQTINSSLHIPVSSDGRLNLVFIGDSTTRGTFCSLCRIIQGTETLGPLDNEVCGGPGYKYSQEHWKWYILDFNKNLKLTFRFERSFNLETNLRRNMEFPLEWAVTKMSPYALFMNTGAWDFDIKHYGTADKPVGHEECYTQNHKEIAALRTFHLANQQLRDVSWQAYDAHVRIIYRNNHYNKRFGVICADEGFEKMLNGTHWEILDSRNISAPPLDLDSQLEDGLHYDRKEIHSVQEHLAIRETAKRNNKTMPGQLEMQIIQHYLNFIFREHLVKLYG